jgi:hypothetical protein
MKKSFLLLPVFLLAACSTATATPFPTPSAKDIEAEEIAVYASLLQAMYPEQNIVLMDQTTSEPSGVENIPAELEYVLGEMTGVDPDTAASFQVRNDATYPLKENMDLGLQFTLLNENDMRQIFNVNQNGWEMFYSRYPDAPGITSVSRVGFNAAMDQALVYIGTESHWLAGVGYYVLMMKVDGIWTINQRVMTWIS